MLEAGGDHEGLRLDGVDLTGTSAPRAHLEDAALVGCVLDGVVLRDARLLGTTLRSCRATALELVGTTARELVLEDCRFGAVTAWGAEWRQSAVRGGKADYWNLRDAVLVDVRLSGCVVGELDLGGARLTRVVLDDVRVDSLDLTGARCEDVDLRGASLRRLDGVEGLRGTTVGQAQLLELAPLLAASLGLRVED